MATSYQLPKSFQVEPEFFSVFNFTAARGLYITAAISHILLLILSGLNAPNDKSRTLLKQHYKGRLLLSNCLNWKINCDDHSSLSSTTAVHIWIISYKLQIRLYTKTDTHWPKLIWNQHHQHFWEWTIRLFMNIWQKVLFLDAFRLLVYTRCITAGAYIKSLFLVLFKSEYRRPCFNYYSIWK